MYNLSSKNWKEFEIESLFEKVINSKAYHKTDLTESAKGIAYVSRTNLNNWLEAIVIDNRYNTNPKDSIAFGAENATFFFQPFEYITGNKMYAICDKRLNKYTGLFIQHILNLSIKNCGFGYGKWLTGTRMKNRSILLPVNDTWSPDWAFMERYMKEHEKNLIARYQSHLDEKSVRAKRERERESS